LSTLAICAVLFAGGVQQVHAGQQAATVRHIAVTGDDHDLDVKIVASKPVAPRTEFVTDPDRLVVDIPEARPDAGLQKIPINRGKLRDVRVALLSANPPVTRVVMDLVAPPEFRVLPLANAVIVKLGSSAMAERASLPAAIVPATNPPEALKSAATTSAVAITPVEQSSRRSWAHWIMPILLTTTIVTMLLLALIANIQNRRYPRGL
jgi:hypothetical protein